jgi:hypothetical protein
MAIAQTYEEKRIGSELLEKFLSKMGAHMTITAAAEKVGIPKSKISRWISRDADLATAHRPTILAFIEGEKCEGQPKWTRTNPISSKNSGDSAHRSSVCIPLVKDAQICL